MTETKRGSYNVVSPPKEQHLQALQDRFANKVLGRLYSQRNWTVGLAFSCGHFLSDTLRMVSGSLANYDGAGVSENWQEVVQDIELTYSVHSSNLSAGPDGCIVMVFPRRSLISSLMHIPGYY